MKIHQRIIWIDIAKGIGIIAVIMGHLGNIPPLLSHIIYSFHISLFFLLSRVFYKDINMQKC